MDVGPNEIKAALLRAMNELVPSLVAKSRTFAQETHYALMTRLSHDQRDEIFMLAAKELRCSQQVLFKVYVKDVTKTIFRPWPDEIVKAAKTWTQVYAKEAVNTIPDLANTKVIRRAQYIKLKNGIFQQIQQKMNLQPLYSICDRSVLERMLGQKIARSLDAELKLRGTSVEGSPKPQKK